MGIWKIKKNGGDVLREMKNISGQWKAGSTDVQVGHGESPKTSSLDFYQQRKSVCQKIQQFPFGESFTRHQVFS